MDIQDAIERGDHAALHDYFAKRLIGSSRDRHATRCTPNKEAWGELWRNVKRERRRWHELVGPLYEQLGRSIQRLLDRGDVKNGIVPPTANCPRERTVGRYLAEQLRGAIRRYHSRTKKQPLLAASLPVEIDDADAYTASTSYRDEIIDWRRRNEIEDMRDRLDRTLDEVEDQVLDLRIKGYDKREIIEMLDLRPSQYRRAVERIRDLRL